MNSITRQQIVGMKYEEHENDNQTRIMLGFAYNFWLSKERKSRIELGSLNLSFQPIITTLANHCSNPCENLLTSAQITLCSS